MYTPAQFREERPDILQQAIRDIQLATLVTAHGEAYAASHVPMVLKTEGEGLVLESHVARPNAHWTILERPRSSLAVFSGPQTYVSPSWYATKREHGKVVPTWNYVAVHALGRLEAVTDPAWLLRHLGDLTDANEAGRAAPWGIDDAPEGFIEKLSRAIVGLRLVVDRLDGSWKMAQHRSASDRAGVIAGLSSEPGSHAAAVAAIMRSLDWGRTTDEPPVR